jgi:hypothetical protein
MGKIGDFLADTARTVVGSGRVWAIFGVLTCTAVVTVGSVLLTAYFIVTGPKTQNEADKKQLKSAVAELKLALTAEQIAREKDKEEHKAQANMDRARITKLEQQKLEDQKTIGGLQQTIASLQRDNKRLTSDFIKSLLATGAKPAPPAFAPSVNTSKLRLPKELKDKLELDVSEEQAPGKPPCLLEFKGYPLLCGDPNANARQ